MIIKNPFPDKQCMHSHWKKNAASSLFVVNLAIKVYNMEATELLGSIEISSTLGNYLVNLYKCVFVKRINTH